MNAKYTIIRDTREQENNGWEFNPSDDNIFASTITDTVKTGDYVVKGYEDIFTIERKGRLSEFATNINEGRFEQELIRMDAFLFPFIILEFEINDILVNWPHNAGIPKDKQSLIKTNKKFILKRMNEMLISHKTKIIFAGRHGKQEAISLIKRFIELYVEKK